MQYSNFNGRTILVTGASGFIGSHLCRRLGEFDVDIHAISRTSQVNSDRIRWWQGDLSDAGMVTSLMQTVRPEYIFDLASDVNGSRDISVVIPTFRSNLMGHIYLMMEACKVGCKRFISAGSMEEPGSNSSWSVATSPYAAAKRAVNVYGEMFHVLYGLPYVPLRLFMVYGPGQKDVKKLIPYSILSMLRGKAPNLTSGRREIDWIYIEDVVDGILAAALTPAIEGEKLDIGSGESVSIRSIQLTLKTLIDPNIEPEFGTLSDRLLEQESLANVAETYARTGWKPKISLNAGLEKTVKWYRENLHRFNIVSIKFIMIICKMLFEEALYPIF